MSEPSPRTGDEPMAFTRSEFLRGALSAWLWFLLFDIVAYGIVIFPLGAFYAAIVAVPVSAAAVVVFVAPAWWLGRALRRTARIAVHIVAFAGFGAAVGLIVTGTFVAIVSAGPSFDLFSILMCCVNTGASALAVVLGWRRGARAVLRPDAPAICGDLDSLAEDEIIAGAEARPGGSAARPAVDAVTEAELAELAAHRAERRRSAG